MGNVVCFLFQCLLKHPDGKIFWIKLLITNSTIHFVFVNFEKLGSLCANPSYLQNTDNLQFSISAFVLLTRWMRHSSLRPVRCVWQVDLSRWSSVRIPLFSSPRAPAKNSVLLRDSVNRSSASPDVGLSAVPVSAANNGTSLWRRGGVGGRRQITGCMT